MVLRFIHELHNTTKVELQRISLNEIEQLKENSSRAKPHKQSSFSNVSRRKKTSRVSARRPWDKSWRRRVVIKHVRRRELHFISKSDKGARNSFYEIPVEGGEMQPLFVQHLVCVRLVNSKLSARWHSTQNCDCTQRIKRVWHKTLISLWGKFFKFQYDFLIAFVCLIKTTVWWECALKIVKSSS